MNVDRAFAIQGWLKKESLEFLAELASHRASILVLGSWLGRAPRAMADNTTGQVTVVDIFPTKEEMSLLSCGTIVWMMRDKPENWLRSEYDVNMQGLNNVATFKMSAVEAAKKFSEVRFDMVFHDAGHTYPEIKADLQVWKPLMEKGTVICGSDFHDTQFGVKQAVTEEYPDAVVGPDTIWHVVR